MLELLNPRSNPLMRPNFGVLLRFMIEAPNAGEAELVIGSVTPQIEAFAKIRKRTVEQYWKIPAYQEVTLYLQPLAARNVIATYDNLVALSQGGWTHGGDEQDKWSRWSVWNPELRLVFLSPSVRWAELSLWIED